MADLESPFPQSALPTNKRGCLSDERSWLRAEARAQVAALNEGQ